MTKLSALLALLAIPALAQVNPTPRNLNFEEGQPGEVPIGWHLTKATAGYNAKLTTANPKSGKYCAEIDWSNVLKPSPFGNLMQSIDAAPYRGKRLRFRAAVRVEPGQRDVQAQL